VNKDTALTKDFVEYEHTHGTNHFMINLVKQQQLCHCKNENHSLNLLVKPGLGIAVPHTNSTVLGNHRDDKYHVAGFVLGIEGGLRYGFFKNFFASFSMKTNYAHYSDVLLYSEGKARQHWISLQTILIVGFQL
jgi:hypothetical protein